MSTEENAMIARRWFSEGGTGHLELVDTIFASDFRTNGKLVGTSGPKRNVTNRLSGFPDFQVQIKELIAIEDTVVVRLTWCGTHLGNYSGLPPTGKHVEVLAITIFHFVEGKVVENWTVIDQFSLFQQLGALPANLLGAQIPADPAQPA